MAIDVVLGNEVLQRRGNGLGTAAGFGGPRQCGLRIDDAGDNVERHDRNACTRVAFGLAC